MVPKRSKYGSKKVEIDGIKFDSKKEAAYYQRLKLLKMAGEIKDFELQPQFILQAGYRDKEGKWIRPIIYKADFKVINNDGSEEIIDVKGFAKKELYVLKKKMLLAQYPEIDFKEA